MFSISSDLDYPSPKLLDAAFGVLVDRHGSDAVSLIVLVLVSIELPSGGSMDWSWGLRIALAGQQ